MAALALARRGIDVTLAITHDGRSFSGDVLIGADGQRSLIRVAVALEHPDAAFAGYVSGSASPNNGMQVRSTRGPARQHWPPRRDRHTDHRVRPPDAGPWTHLDRRRRGPCPDR